MEPAGENEHEAAAATEAVSCTACEGNRQYECEWFSYEDSMLALGSELQENGATNKHIRWRLYGHYTYEKYGILGKKNRKQLPLCIETTIKTTYPPPADPQDDPTDIGFVGFLPVGNN